MALDNFLSRYANRQLRYITIPGSHDAGIAADEYQSRFFISTPANTVTQTDTVGTQASLGSRFFDIRVRMYPGGLKTFHTAKDTKRLGGTGQTFISVLDELKLFVARKPTEFIIIRLSHLRDTKAVFQEIHDWANDNNRQNLKYLYRGTGNIATKKVSEVAGKLILVIDNKQLKDKNQIKFEYNGFFTRIPPQSDGFHQYYANKAGKPLKSIDDGLQVCGEFSNSSTLTDIMGGQRDNYTTHDQHKGGEPHLYCIYWTSTGGNIQGNTTENMTTQRFNELILSVGIDENNPQFKELFHHEANLHSVNSMGSQAAFKKMNVSRRRAALNACSVPNIVMYDFINEDVSNEIIKLNDLYHITYC